MLKYSVNVMHYCFNEVLWKLERKK